MHCTKEVRWLLKIIACDTPQKRFGIGPRLSLGNLDVQ